MWAGNTWNTASLIEALFIISPTYYMGLTCFSSCAHVDSVSAVVEHVSFFYCRSALVHIFLCYVLRNLEGRWCAGYVSGFWKPHVEAICCGRT